MQKLKPDQFLYLLEKLYPRFRNTSLGWNLWTDEGRKSILLECHKVNHGTWAHGKISLGLL